MAKKILISHKDINAVRSGVPRLILSEIKYFKENGHRPYAIAERILKRPITQAGGEAVKTFRWPISGSFRRKFYRKQVQKYIDKLKPALVIGHGDIIEQDICFIHNCTHLAYQLINGKPLPEDDVVGKIHSEILNQKKFKVLVCNSQMMKNDLTKRFNLSDRKIVVHYPDLDISQFGHNTKNKRAELGISDDTVVIGLITSGNFKKRNVKLLLESLHDLKTDQKIHILIVGNDKSEPFQNLIDNSIHPISFLRPIDKVEEYYSTTDIFVLPAHIEEFGMSVLEAMFYKNPVIVSRYVGSSEIFTESSQKNILNSLTKGCLLEIVTPLINNKELREKQGEENALIAQKYSSLKQHEKFTELLKELNFH